MLRFQQRFATAFSKLDPEPVTRRDHFSWLPQYDNVRHIGWYGSIVGVQAQGDGSALVRISIKPYLYSPVMKTLLVDYVTETYRFAGGQVELVNSDAAIARPELQSFPVIR